MTSLKNMTQIRSMIDIVELDAFCIATKRGLSPRPYFLWFENGKSLDITFGNVNNVLIDELTHHVDIVWIGDQDKDPIASVVMEGGALKVIEALPLTRWLGYGFKSFYMKIFPNEIMMPVAISINNLLPKWVAVDSFLPEDGQSVVAIQDLTWRENGKIWSDVYFYRAGIGFVRRQTDDDAYGFITYWMPLNGK
jgi:hypothetical protein